MSGHLIVLPILLPLFVGALLLLVDERRRQLKAGLSLVASAGLLGLAVTLLLSADQPSVLAYLVGNWPMPIGIVLVLDRFAALMLVLAATLALAALVYSLARWHRAGAHFHSLFQFLLCGINGAFLTGDLFNLFVFFEVMLAASYGLALHGSGPTRVRAGLHYVAVNLVASLFFLIGVALVYGVTGTLNMADIAAHIPSIADEDRMLLETGAAVLGVAFLIKSAVWPLNFWLTGTYTAAAAPVAAVFAIMSKVGVYVILRLSILFFGPEAGASAGFGGDVLLTLGMATIVVASIGVLASQSMGRLASYSVIVSSGTLLAAAGFADAAVTAGLMFYLVSSTLALAGFFLLIELVERGQDPSAEVLAVTKEAFGEGEAVEEDEASIVAIPLPATVAILGIGFAVSGLLIAGMPPLSGFIGKLALLAAVVPPDALAEPLPATHWLFVVLLILSGLSALIAMTRAGIRIFWAPVDDTAPQVAVVEIAPVVALLALAAGLAIFAGPALAYMEAAAGALHERSIYIDGVLSTLPVAPAEAAP